MWPIPCGPDCTRILCKFNGFIRLDELPVALSVDSGIVCVFYVIKKSLVRYYGFMLLCYTLSSIDVAQLWVHSSNFLFKGCGGLILYVSGFVHHEYILFKGQLHL